MACKRLLKSLSRSAIQKPWWSQVQVVLGEGVGDFAHESVTEKRYIMLRITYHDVS